MANIELKEHLFPRGLQNFYKDWAGELEYVLDVLKKIQGQLNDQVEAKKLIDDRFDRIQKLLKKEKEYLTKAGNLTETACAEFEQIDKQQANVFSGTEKVPTATSAIKDVITKNYVSKYGSMSGFLLAAGSALTMSNLSKWNTKMTAMNKNMQTTNAAIKKEMQTITKQTSTKPTDLVAFDNSKYKSVCKNKNGYSNYTILAGVSTEYLYCQKNYSKKGFASKGCYSTADAIMQSIADQKKYDPTKTWDEKQQLSSGLVTQKISGSKNYTEAQMLAETYKQLQKGNPVMLRVETSSGASGHSVVAVGLRNGANPNKLTDADILIVDPADGKIKTLAERYKKVGNSALKENSGYSMRIPS